MWVVETAGARIFSSHFAKIKTHIKLRILTARGATPVHIHQPQFTRLSPTIKYKHKYYISIHSVKNLKFSNSNDMNPKVLRGSAYIDTSRTK